MLEARALLKNIHSSPRKMRLVIDMIRGKNAAEALGILEFATQHASIEAKKTLTSAVANLRKMKEDKQDQMLDEDIVYVKEVFVNQGPTMKRMLPAPMGRAYRVRKRSNHLTIIVAERPTPNR
jgi:large subunit ribosomal protein L22